MTGNADVSIVDKVPSAVQVLLVIQNDEGESTSNVAKEIFPGTNLAVQPVTKNEHRSAGDYLAQWSERADISRKSLAFLLSLGVISMIWFCLAIIVPSPSAVGPPQVSALTLHNHPSQVGILTLHHLSTTVDVLTLHHPSTTGKCINPLDARRRSTNFAQTPYAAGSLLTDGTIYERSCW